jgi:hypothetical protein
MGFLCAVLLHLAIHHVSDSKAARPRNAERNLVVEHVCIDVFTHRKCAVAALGVHRRAHHLEKVTDEHPLEIFGGGFE